MKSLFDLLPTMLRPYRGMKTPFESTYELPLKLISTKPCGPLTLSQFATNPDKDADYLFVHHSRQLTNVQGDFESLRCEVVKLPTGEAQQRTHHEQSETPDALVTLTNSDGKILLMEYLDPQAAERRMASITWEP